MSEKRPNVDQMVVMIPPGNKKKRKKMLPDTNQPLEVGAPLNVPTADMDYTDIFKKITEEMFSICGNKITKDFLVLRAVNVAWKNVVAHHLRTVGEELTIEVNFSRPVLLWGDKRFTVLHENRGLKLMHISDVAANFTRLSELSTAVEDVYEPKGLLIQVPFEKLSSFIDFIKSLEAVDSCGNLLTMNQTTLQLAYIDKYKYQQHFDFEELIRDASEPLIELEKLFPKLEHLFLTISMPESRCHDLFAKLMESIALNRQGGALKTFEINFLSYNQKEMFSPLEKLVPQLEHLGLNYQEDKLLALNSATDKLRSLKLVRGLSDMSDVNYRNLIVTENQKAALNRITSLEIAYRYRSALEILEHCTTVSSLKLHVFGNDYYVQNFGGLYFYLLRPMSSTLKKLTLIGVDLKNESAEDYVLPELTTLTLVSYKPILQRFRQKRRKIGFKRVDQVDVPLFVRVIGAWFPKLQSLNMMGQVFGNGNVKRQLEKEMTKQLPKVTLQLNFSSIQH